MSVTYLTTPIVEVRNDPPPRGSGMTRDGYTKRSGAPTARMIRLQGEKRWRRLMVWQFSNLGTMFVNIAGKPHVVREEMIPQEAAISREHHATKKPAQLDREIAQSVGKRIDRKKLAELMFPWGGDFAYGQGTGAIGAVASYYASDKKYPDRMWVERAIKAVETDIPKAEAGAHGWTTADANSLRRIAQGLRYYLIHDYKDGGPSHSTIAHATRAHALKKAPRGKPRVVHVEAKTPAGYRWLRMHARGATVTPEGFAVTNEHEWAQSLSAAGAYEIK